MTEWTLSPGRTLCQPFQPLQVSSAGHVNEILCSQKCCVCHSHCPYIVSCWKGLLGGLLLGILHIHLGLTGKHVSGSAEFLALPFPLEHTPPHPEPWPFFLCFLSLAPLPLTISWTRRNRLLISLSSYHGFFLLCLIVKLYDLGSQALM